MNSSSFSSQKLSKPKTLVCYICGRQFGTKSLSIHLKACNQKFTILQDQKTDKNLKIKLPEPPSLLKLIFNKISEQNLNEEQIEMYNRQAINLYKYKILPACKFCGRTFNEQSLVVHLKACSKKNGQQNRENQQRYKLLDQIKKPRTLACCVCGRQFGLTSLKIHYPQCKDKLMCQQLKKPYKQRNSLPQFSKEQQEMIINKSDWTVEEIQQFNEKALAHFRNKVMTKCQNCNRTFLPQSYKRHQKNCKLINGNNIVSKDSKGVSKEYSVQKNQNIKKPKVLMCHICGRQFGLTSLKIHQKSCAEKFINQQNKRAKNQRRPLPQLSIDFNQFNLDKTEEWDLQKIDQYNLYANQIYKRCSLFLCHICGRKFLEAALVRHLNYCEKNAEREALKQSKGIIKKQKLSSRSKQKLDKKVSLTNDSLVKNQFNSNQLTKYNQQKCRSVLQAQKDKQNDKDQNAEIICPSPFKHKQQFNQTIKQVHEEFQSTLKQNLVDLKKNQIWQKTRQQADELQDLTRIQCTKCGRKFVEDRIYKHESICKGQKRKKDSIQNKIVIVQKKQQKQKPKAQIKQIQPQSQSEQFQIKKTNKLIKEQQTQNDKISGLSQCPKCAKKFIPAKLQTHIQRCKQVAYRSKINKQNYSKELKQQILGNQTQDITQKHKIVKQIVKDIKQSIFNSNQIQIEQKLINCQYCKRKFCQDRIQKHENVCPKKKQFQSKGIPKLKQNQKQTVIKKQADIVNICESSNTQINLVKCSKCNRKFAQDRLQKHQTVCKGVSNLMKKVPQKKFIQKEAVGQINQTIEKNSKFSENQKLQKKNIFNIKPSIKKKQIKSQENNKQTHAKLIKENLHLSNQFIDSIWDTKQIIDISNNEENIKKASKTAYSNGFFHKQPDQIKSQPSQYAKIKQKLCQIQNIKIITCNKCGRIFNEDTISKHQSICKGFPHNFQKKSTGNLKKDIQPKSNISKLQKEEIWQISSSKNIIKQFKQIKHMKINDSIIDLQLENQLNYLNKRGIQTPKKECIAVRSTYGGGQKFYSRKIAKKSHEKEERNNELNIQRNLSNQFEVPLRSPKVSLAKKWNKQLPSIQ